MIYLFGDSHCNNNFKNLPLPNMNLYRNSITMHRVGRDHLNFINWRMLNIADNDTVIYQFGEVDCRCHVGKQRLLGRDTVDIITELTQNYIMSILLNKQMYNNIKIIVCCIPPPIMCKDDTSRTESIINPYPVVGTDSDRVIYTKMANDYLCSYCKNVGFTFFDYYDYYADKDGLLRLELSDNICHIADNKYILEKIIPILNS